MQARMFITETGDAPASARGSADRLPALPPLPELDTVCRVARAHFGAAGAFIARADADAQRVLAADGSQQSAPFEAGVVGSDRTEVLSGLSEGQHVVLPSGAS